MFFQDFFTKLDLTAVSAAASLLLLLSLLAFVITKARHLFRQNHQTGFSHLGISHTAFEISLGKLRVAVCRRAATLPVEAVTGKKNGKRA